MNRHEHWIARVRTGLLNCARLGVLCVSVLSVSIQAAVSPSSPTVILVVGAPGEAEYGSNFLHQAALWQNACQLASTQPVIIGLDESAQTNDLEVLRRTLADQPKDGLAQLWLILIGHGTFDGQESWFNLRGPDISGTELARWLQPFSRPLAVIDTAPCSGPWIKALSATNRVVITATRTGNEQSFTRFGQQLAESLASSEADLDHDGQVSLLEAFLTAARKTAEFYKVQGRILTEHALLDDNGDQLGTPPDWFHGLHPAKQAKEGAPIDGLLAQQFRLIPAAEDRLLTPEQLAQRDALEHNILLLREKKSQMPEADYYQELESKLLQLAKWYAANTGTNAAAQNP